MVFENPPARRISGADTSSRSGSPARQGDVAELKASHDDPWLDHREGDLPSGRCDDEFDIVAWFAVQEDQDRARGMTECWYG